MHIQKIADAYLKGAHDPTHPSYEAFAVETLKQYKQLRVRYGMELTSDTPYATSYEMFQDLRLNRRLKVFSGGSPMEEGHPLLAEIEPGVSLNIAFRFVHDIYGHHWSHAPFETFEGELEAYRNHREMYSKLARPALFTETVAQLCHYYALGDFVPVQRCVIL